MARLPGAGGLSRTQCRHDVVQAGHLIGGNGCRCVRHAVRIEPAAVDAVAVGAEDVGVQAVADDDRAVLAACAGHVGRILEEAYVRLGVAAGFRGGNEGNVVAQAGCRDAPVLDGFDAIGDNAHFADGGQGGAHLLGAIDEYHRVGQRFQV